MALRARGTLRATLRQMKLLLLAALAGALALPAAGAQAADPDFSAAFISKTGHTGCEVRAYPRGRVWVSCSQEGPTHKGDFNERIAYMTLHKHGKSRKHVSGLSNIEWTAAKVPYGKWLWPAKMRNVTGGAEKRQHVPARAYHGTRQQLRCIIRPSGLTCKNADQHGFMVALGKSRRF